MLGRTPAPPAQGRSRNPRAGSGLVRQASQPGGVHRVQVDLVGGTADGTGRALDVGAALLLLDIGAVAGPAAVRVRHGSQGRVTRRVGGRELDAPVRYLLILQRQGAEG